MTIFSGGFLPQMFWGPGLQHRSRPLCAPFETRRQDSVRRTPACWADTVVGFIEKDHKDISFYGLIVIFRCFQGRERPNFYSSSWAVLMIEACKCFSVLEFIMLSYKLSRFRKIACRLRTTLSKSKIGLKVVDYSWLFLFFCPFFAYWQWSVVDLTLHQQAAFL